MRSRHFNRRPAGLLRRALTGAALLFTLATTGSAALAQTADTPPVGYTRCAGEGQACSFSGTASVVYGARGTWTAPRSFSGGSVSCGNAVFGDPLYGVVKACYAQAGTASPPPPTTDTPPAGYTRCAVEGQACSFSGTANVVYGALGTWSAPRSFAGGTACSNAVFGDPLYGVAKSCYQQAAATAKLSLSLTLTGTGGVGFSDGSACAASCVKSFDAGSSVTLAASPAAGHSFAGWGGACSGTGGCTVAMNAAKGVTATFNAVAGGAGKVYYVDANAADDNGNGSAYAPKKYLSSGAALLSAAGGDTLIVKAGTYGNAKDILANQGSGKAGAWNVIKAEVDGSVAITVPLALGLVDHFLQLEGLKWDSKSIKSVTGRYVKILRCAFKGGPMSDNTVNLGIGTNDATPGAQYILVEDSHLYGVGGRYGVLVYNSDKVVLRRLVVRHEPGWADTKGDPEAGMALYNSTDVLTQNLVVLDSSGGPAFTSAIYHPSNSRASSNIRNVGAVVLNTAGPGVGWDDSAVVSGMTLEDSAVVGAASIGVFVNGGQKNVALKNVTLSRIGSHGTAAYGSNSAANFSIRDSIVANVGGEQFKNGITATNVTSVAPKWLTQPVGTNGATILKRLGKSGALWGEAGFDQAQLENLWPFPNEAAIKKSMCADVGIGTGFCAAASLTRYVWEQLGNPLPDGIYPGTMPTASLTVSAATGGSVASSPAGIQCGGSCSFNFGLGTLVTLTATPAAGHTFTGWGGACSGVAACTVTMDAAKSVTAGFTAVAAATQTLSVAVSGTGGVGFSDGSACAASCSKAFASGASVTLAASPVAGYSFSGWGGACSGTGSCTVKMDGARSVTATFTAVAPATRTLTVTVSGMGSVAISSSTGASSCSATCTRVFPAGAAVALAATPATGHSFSGWGGACSGSAACAVPLASDAAVTATFNAVATPPGVSAYYLSPTGSNGADCKSQAAACKTFAHVFSKMAAGDELVLLDGSYSSATGTGTMHWNDGANSAQVPSGTAARPTVVRALNAGKAIIQGEVFIGRRTRKDSHILLRGLTVEGGVQLYNTSFVTVKEVGVHGPMGVGTNDHDQGNTDNLIEDVWVWAAQQRVIAINYRAHRNVWRRMVVRGDGCNTAECTGGGSPSVGFTVYDSHDVSVQNVIVVDRVLTGVPASNYYADFAIASHTGGLYTFGRNEWLGTVSLNAPDQGYYMEPDVGTIETPTIKVSNAVAWNAALGGYNLARDAQQSVLENLTLNVKSGDALRVAPDMPNPATVATVRNLLVSGSGRYAVNSSVQPSHVSQTGSWSQGPFNQTTPANLVAAPAPAQKYITRIEAGSPLKGAGAGGADIGANVLYRYGSDGKRFGDAGFNTLGATLLWPWPNEDRIKREMCAATTRGFCATGKRLDGVNPVSLTSYIWEQLGNPVPASFAGP